MRKFCQWLPSGICSTITLRARKAKLVEQFLSNPAEVRVEEVQYVLEAFGFEEKRSKGSHHSFEDSRGRILTIPEKGGKKVKRVYIKRVVELLNLDSWLSEIESDDEPESNDE